MASARTWSPSDADDIARHCAGAAVLGMPRWRFKDGEGHPVLLPTEVNRYEGALARTLGLSTFVLVQRDVLRRVVFAYNFGGYVGEFPPDAEVDWLHKDEFLVPFGYWKAQLEERRDIFLGYCSSSAATAADIKRYLLGLGARVLDWQRAQAGRPARESRELARQMLSPRRTVDDMAARLGFAGRRWVRFSYWPVSSAKPRRAASLRAAGQAG